MKKRLWPLVCLIYSTPQEHLFQIFKAGAVIFFYGVILIYASSQLLTPSLLQEIITLVGLLLIMIGLVIALLAEIRILIGRIVHFFFQ